MTSATPRIAGLAAATLVYVFALSGCGSSDDSSAKSSASASSSSSSSAATPSQSQSSGGASSSKSATIMIKDFKFSGPGTIAAGETITVTNADSEAHTVTADKGGAFDVNIPPGKSAKLTAPAKAGSYPFHCTYHSNMHGTLTVS